MGIGTKKIKRMGKAILALAILVTGLEARSESRGESPATKANDNYCQGRNTDCSPGLMAMFEGFSKYVLGSAREMVLVNDGGREKAVTSSREVAPIKPEDLPRTLKKQLESILEHKKPDRALPMPGSEEAWAQDDITASGDEEATAPVQTEEAAEPLNPSQGERYIHKVVIDPGHGGMDPGALGTNGLKEKDVNLDIALKLKRILLKSGYQVVMTRSGDYYLSLSERAAIANQSNADVLISIHSNASYNPEAQGASIYVAHWDENSLLGHNSQLLAQVMLQRIVANVGRPSRGVHQQGFHVLSKSEIPALLVECSFISNDYEKMLLSDPDYRQSISEAIFLAVDSIRDPGQVLKK